MIEPTLLALFCVFEKFVTFYILAELARHLSPTYFGTMLINVCFEEIRVYFAEFTEFSN